MRVYHRITPRTGVSFRVPWLMELPLVWLLFVWPLLVLGGVWTLLRPFPQPIRTIVFAAVLIGLYVLGTSTTSR